MFGLVLTFFDYRSASWPRSRKSAICSSGSAVSPESSWQGTGKPRGPRALRSSALRTAPMPPVLATRWMAVCAPVSLLGGRGLLTFSSWLSPPYSPRRVRKEVYLDLLLFRYEALWILFSSTDCSWLRFSFVLYGLINDGCKYPTCRLSLKVVLFYTASHISTLPA